MCLRIATKKLQKDVIPAPPTVMNVFIFSRGISYYEFGVLEYVASYLPVAVPGYQVQYSSATSEKKCSVVFRL